MNELMNVGRGVAAPMKTAVEIGKCLQEVRLSFETLETELEQKNKRIAELERECERLRNDPWASRVTYDNVVELIASYEDAAKRDEARNLLEPMLKREQVRQLRRDIKLKVAELNAEEVPDKVNIIHVEGDYVMNKRVENEIGNVEAGGTGVIKEYHKD